MGDILNQVCCNEPRYRKESLNENPNDKRSSSSNQNIETNDSYQKLSKIDKQKKPYPSSLLKPLPLNEIKLKRNLQLEEVDTLSKLPISNRNVIRKQSGNPLDHYDIIKKLGKGTFGTVYKVMSKRTGTIRAMKVIPKNNLKNDLTDDDIIEEINILKKLEHPHIIKLFEFYIYNKKYYLINEFCTDGDLSDKLAQIRMFPEFIVKILMIQIFNAVNYLNQNYVIHGDLKLENIMIDSFLNKDELLRPKGTKCNFIQSLLEDEKEINGILKEKHYKRSCSLNFDKKGIQKKENENKRKNNEFNNEKVQSLDKLIKIKNSSKKSTKSSLFKTTTIKEEKKENESNVLNGKDKNNNDKDENNINNNINNKNNDENNNNNNDDNKDSNIIKKNNSIKSNEEVENENKVLNTIKPIFLRNREKSKTTKTLKSDKQYVQFVIEHTNSKLASEEYDYDKIVSNLKKTLTINSMKMKNFELKLIDFGCSKIFSKNNENFKDIIGTLVYCSPEVLKNNYSNQCDIWSCGVIMYVLLSGHFPFFGKNDKIIEKKILSGKFTFNNKYFSHVSEKAKDLIRKCLIYDKNKRITAEEALKHEFFSDDINPNNIFLDEIDNRNVLISLKNFSQHSKIYQTVLAFLSHNFADKKELNKLKKIFYRMDLNLDGKLSKYELFVAFRDAGMEMNEDQIEEIIKSVDFNGNEFIEYEEFIRVTLPKEQLFKENNLKYAFDMFDIDKNGKISLNNFKEILGIKKIKDKNIIEELLKEIPIHGDEEMTFEEFKNYIKN